VAQGRASNDLRHMSDACDLLAYAQGQIQIREPRLRALLEGFGLDDMNDKKLVFTLGWPPKALNPNWSGHWAQKAAAKKAYRRACAAIVRDAGGLMPPLGPDDAVAVSLAFYPPDRRSRDWDNLLATMKSGLDGLADGLGVNDSLFRPTVTVADQIGGFVRVTVEVV